MKHFAVGRLATLSLLFILPAFFLVSASLPPRVTATYGRTPDGNRRAQLAQLEARLKAARPGEFNAAQSAAEHDPASNVPCAALVQPATNSAMDDLRSIRREALGAAG